MCKADVRTNDTAERVAVSKITAITTTTTRRARALQEGIFKCVRSNHYLSLPARREIVRCCSRSHHSPLLSFSLSLSPHLPSMIQISTLSTAPASKYSMVGNVRNNQRERGGGEQTLRPRWDTWILDSWMWSRTDGCLRRQIDVSHVWASPILWVKKWLSISATGWHRWQNPLLSRNTWDAWAQQDLFPIVTCWEHVVEITKIEIASQKNEMMCYNVLDFLSNVLGKFTVIWFHFWVVVHFKKMWKYLFSQLFFHELFRQTSQKKPRWVRDSISQLP